MQPFNIFTIFAVFISLGGLFLATLTFMTNGMRANIKDLQTRMIACEDARSDLAKQNLALLNKLVDNQVVAAGKLAESNTVIAKALTNSQK